MGNAVAPAPNPASLPVNTLLSSTAELDPSLAPPPYSDAATDSSALPSSSTVDIPPSSSDPTPHLDDLSPQQLLFYAADNGDCALIRSALSQGALPSLPDLGLAAQDADKRAAAAAKSGAKEPPPPSSSDAALYKDLVVTRDSALHKAAAHGHADAVDLLCSLGADVEARDVLGSSPLHRAVSSRHPGVARCLLGRGARVDAANAIGNSPLHTAAYLGDLELAQCLLAHARHDAYRLVVACNAAGLTPIDYARKKPMHALLTQHRLAVSHTNSFVHDPTHHDPTATPHGAGAGEMTFGHFPLPVEGAVGGLPDSRRGSGRMLVQHRSGEVGVHGGHHHHAPNPPLGSVGRTGSGREVSEGAEGGGGGGRKGVVEMPSFDKAPSLDSHEMVEEGERAQSAGSMVEPVGVGGLTLKGRVSGATLSALSFQMMPNECDGGRGEEKEQLRPYEEESIAAEGD